ncbi:MAG: undecaprenyldiphospho-muramoylpentapeptide beta-N-acetylglucosaminyltransferase [Gammaproteobacteria bacterium]|nr:undecaprenyldiphospho-muramoylpentapeptide beta-N-acetylglucosaminyltransferase [Gammaproteobacteria bacterium]MCW9005494.1 undecaprenyldiphospho-muramoylpentapeptide beta-N-acetylglucosaminyltransferase [Gammaproteobacteria bacterium]MCW9055249.1 undecaprenyldiphospho-muramoylpentapeptide beta-N-acetylglucosaminyltransferase [Gammaproteobacteria bacterium]
MTQPVMIMAGGTGGHVYPALAVADELRSRGVPVIWLGTKNGIEARLVPEAGIAIDWLGVSGLRGKGIVSLLMAPVNLIMACIQASRILLKRKPCAVLGMGGFVSGPGGLMAKLLKMPLLIHEQNAVPGLTNRLLSHLANKVMEAFPNSFNKKSLHVGNPVRRSITSLPSPEQRYKDRQGPLKLLVFGGSLGASRLNEVVPQALVKIDAQQRPLIRHQAGIKNIEQAVNNYNTLNIKADVTAYIDDMAEAYAWADIVLCRAGAMSVSELAAAGVASILVPYPHAVDDHQTANAKYLSDRNAAILLQQNELTPDALLKILNGLTREATLEMANKARQSGMPESTRLVAEQCLLEGGVVC